MPIYCYSNDDEVFERIFPRGEAPEIITTGSGTVATRDRRSEFKGMTAFVKGIEDSGNHRGRLNPWPMDPCVGSGVGPHQATELRDHFTNHGVPTEVSKEGDPIYTSAAHRKKALRCRGMYDRNSFS